MISRNTDSTHPYKPSLSEAAAWLVAQRIKEERSLRRWVCMGCGTTHTVILPEECKNCGTTALEFEYSATPISH